MRRTKAFVAPLAAVLITAFFAVFVASLMGACQVFLGPEPDIGPQAVLRSLWNDFNETHAYIDIRMSNNKNFTSWDDVYEYYHKILLDKIPDDSPGANRDGRYLFYTCTDMIGELMDPHVSMFAPGGNFFWTTVDDIQKKEEGWFDLALIKENYLKDHGFTRGFFTYGRLNEPYNNIGYIHISSFIDSYKLEQQDWAREIDGILEYFREYNIQALVIDIRGNSGGSGPVAEFIAARFASVQKNYMKASAKKGSGRNDFSAPMIFRVKPEGTRFTKRIALLTNKATISAAEWFVMALKTQGHVTHVGTTTRGAFSPKISRPMINGWYYTISAFRVTDMDGKCLEGIGISPEPEFIFTGDSDEGAVAGERKDIQFESVLGEVGKWLNR